MNSVVRKRAAGLGLVVAAIFIADRVTRSKNNTLTMGINGQLDQMNTVADFGRDSS